MIPQEITREHILAAIRRIDEKGVPWQRGSSKFDLVYEGKKYPPKYVLSVAGEVAFGKELDPGGFNGGDETNEFLKSRGFDVSAKSTEGIGEALEFVMSRYVAARSEAFSSKHDVFTGFRRLKECFSELSAVSNSGNIKIEYGVGKGNWAKVPWIALLDRRETTSTQKGVYVVLLFREDMSGVYATLNQGVTELTQKLKSAAKDELRKRAEGIRKGIRQPLLDAGFLLDGKIDLRTDAHLGLTYQEGTIAYKLYERAALPADDVIASDLDLLLSAYADYLATKEHPEGGTTSNPPSPPAHDPEKHSEFDRQEAMENLIADIRAMGFIFEPWQIATYVTALRTKPFVILAGISGTGKSKLPAIVAECTGGAAQLVPVRPDWTDSSDLLGYCDLQGDFREGILLSTADAASSDGGREWFCILDEMNLARVEQYFAEVLSRMEDRRPGQNGGFESGPLLSTNLAAAGRWAHVNLPHNFAVIGTVNMDESAHGFSRKVLDRAFTIELSDVDLSLWGKNELAAEVVNGDRKRWPSECWRPRALSLATLGELTETEQNTAHQVIQSLIELNKLLVHAQLQVGYRTRDEVALFVMHAAETPGGFRTFADATVDPLDLAIMMKVLPRIIGGSSAIRRVLLSLLGWSISGKPLAEDSEADNHLSEWDKDDRPPAFNNAKFPRTAARLCLMWERLQGEGFASFWL